MNPVKVSAAVSGVSAVNIRRAERDDVGNIHRCLQPFVKQGKVLARAIPELTNMVHQYFVAELNGKIVGCVALEIYSKKLCEIRSLAVSTEAQGLGVGKQLVQACLGRAREEQILEVMAITSSDEFFLSCGFDFTLPGEKKALFFLPNGTPPAIDFSPEAEEDDGSMEMG
jgi:N-acetylglutamate synthase-like GNAT family acetyltransferase